MKDLHHTIWLIIAVTSYLCAFEMPEGYPERFNQLNDGVGEESPKTTLTIDGVEVKNASAVDMISALYAFSDEDKKEFELLIARAEENKKTPTSEIDIHLFACAISAYHFKTILIEEGKEAAIKHADSELQFYKTNYEKGLGLGMWQLPGQALYEEIGK